MSTCSIHLKHLYSIILLLLLLLLPMALMMMMMMTMMTMMTMMMMMMMMMMMTMMMMMMMMIDDGWLMMMIDDACWWCMVMYGKYWWSLLSLATILMIIINIPCLAIHNPPTLTSYGLHSRKHGGTWFCTFPHEWLWGDGRGMTTSQIPCQKTEHIPLKIDLWKEAINFQGPPFKGDV